MILILLIILLTAAFFFWFRWYERELIESHLQKQKEASEVLNQKLEEIREQKIQEQKELSGIELFITQYFIQKESYHASKKEIDQTIDENIFSVSDLILLADKRIEVSESFKEFLSNQPELNDSIDAFIAAETAFLDADIEAYTLVKEYYTFFDESFALNEDRMRQINFFLSESLRLETEAGLILQKVIQESSLDYLVES